MAAFFLVTTHHVYGDIALHNLASDGSLPASYNAVDTNCVCDII